MFPNLQNPYFYLSNIAKPPNVNVANHHLGIGSAFTNLPNFSLSNPLLFQPTQPQMVSPFWNRTLHKYNQLFAQRKVQEAMLRSFHYDVTAAQLSRYNSLQHNSFAPRLKKFSPIQLRPMVGRPRNILPCNTNILGAAQTSANQNFRGISEAPSTSSSVSSKATSVETKLGKIKIGGGRRGKQKQNTPCKCKVCANIYWVLLLFYFKIDIFEKNTY